MEKLAYSIKDAGRALSLGTTKIYELINDKQLEKVKLGRKTLITSASMKALIERSKISGDA